MASPACVQRVTMVTTVRLSVTSVQVHPVLMVSVMYVITSIMLGQ